MITIKRFSLFLSLFYLSACGAKKESLQSKELVEITSRTEEGFQDIVLTIVESKNTGDSEFEFIARGKSNQEIVGLKIAIKEKSHKVVFYSLGQESDNFIRILSNLYGLSTDKKFSKDAIPFDLILMSKEANREYYKFKLFFDPDDKAGLYSELYLHLNLSDGEIELKEKDEEYRESLIEAMTR